MRQSERLWHLAHKYHMGMSFHGLWVEDTNLADVALRIGADPVSGVGCKWTDVGAGLNPSDNTGIVWMGRLNTSWTQIVVVGATPFDPLLALSVGNRRALEVVWTVNGVHDVLYAVDGNYVTALSVTRPGVRKGTDPHALDRYASDLQFDAEDSSWESDPDLLPGWLEYSAWEETLSNISDQDLVDDAYESMPSRFRHLLELSLNGYSPPIATCITSALIVVGRVTGRELDEEWMNGLHTRFVIY
ncbi:hypothetical protein [Streptosporangium sp. H16]|uniref:hypothetical protein n=1 Tax=Streptosporangium sp. H16 TaxID=3444184 RepID=UPI003F7A7693